MLRVDGHDIELTRQDKVLFPGSGITKGDLVRYYERIAPVALPHWRDRPLSQHRFPDGIESEGFFQKEIPDHYPSWVERAELKAQTDGSVTYAVANNAATLVYLANQASITPHLGLSRTDRIDHPDWLVIDLDPQDDDFEKVRFAARATRRFLDRLELPSFVQTSGSRGLHVFVPLDRSADFTRVRAFARDLARHLARQHPERLTTEQRKAKRGDRVYLDILRNAYGQTTAAPYAVRAKEGAPVATPLDWSEVADARLTPQRYTIANIFRRLSRKADPWRDMASRAGSLDRPHERLRELGAGTG
jgi:bifunctional non-homologous end joining protein LigD